jgi:hypothetical protein
VDEASHRVDHGCPLCDAHWLSLKREWRGRKPGRGFAQIIAGTLISRGTRITRISQAFSTRITRTLEILYETRVTRSSQISRERGFTRISWALARRDKSKPGVRFFPIVRW